MLDYKGNNVASPVSSPLLLGNLFEVLLACQVGVQLPQSTKGTLAHIAGKDHAPFTRSGSQLLLVLLAGLVL